MTQQAGLDYAQRLEKAWTRIKRTSWDQMAWFVKLANTKLDELSGGDIQNLLEECEAIRTIVIPFHPSSEDRKRYPHQRFGIGSVTPTRTDLMNIHAAIKPHLENLANGKEVSIGPISLTHQTTFRKSNDREKEAGYPPTRIYPLVWSCDKSMAWRDDFLVRFSRLLEDFVDSIRRCPHCGRVFVQNRKNSRYCDKACYTVAGMRRLRAERASQAKR